MVGEVQRYICHDARRGKYFHFGAAEYEVARNLDGETSLEQLHALLEQHGHVWSIEEIGELIASLAKAGLAELRGPVSPGTAAGGPPDQGLAAAPPRDIGDRAAAARSDANVSSAASTAEATAPGAADPEAPATGNGMVWLRGTAWLISQRIPLIHADRPAVWLTRRLHRLFSSLGVLVWTGMVLFALLILARHGERFSQELRHILTPAAWPWMFGFWLLGKVAHETGHAIAARRQGVRVGKAGILFFLFAPLAYIDVTDAWRLPRKWSRIQIALAGVYIELGLAAIAVMVWNATDDVMLRYLAAQCAFVLGPATLLVNANPLLRLDGYFVLSDALDIPNLRMHGRRQLSGWLQHRLLGTAPVASLLTGWRRYAATLHACASVLFQILWMGGIIWGLRHWAGGVGFVIGAAAVALWVLVPLSRWVMHLRSSEQWPRLRLRLGLVTAVAILFVALLGQCRSPLGRRIPVVVRYAGEQVLRADSDGFVRQVHVTAGTPVEAGDALIELEEPGLAARLESLRLDLRAAKLRRNQLGSQGQHARARGEAERAVTLERQITEIEAQLAALTIRATGPGTVKTPRLDDLVGRYVRRGEVLVRIGNETRKELLASIEGSDAASYEAAVRRKALVPVRFRGGETCWVRPFKAAPRATRNIPHPVLAATAGGPLPVEATDEEDESSSAGSQLTEPRSESRSKLPAAVAKRFRAGQRGTLILGDRRTLWQRAADVLRER